MSFLASVLILGGLVFWFFYSEEFKIKEIIMEGAPDFQKEKLLAEIEDIMASKVFYVIPQNCFFSFPAEKARWRLTDNFLNLKNIEVEKIFPFAISVRAEERKPVAVLCLPNCFFVDETGFIFGDAPFFSPGIFVKFFDKRAIKPEKGNFLLETNDFKRMLDFANRLKDFFSVSSIILENEKVYKLYAETGQYLIVDGGEDWALTYNNLVAFFNEMVKNDKDKFEYIDFRFGNKIFFKQQ